MLSSEGMNRLLAFFLPGSVIVIIFDMLIIKIVFKRRGSPSLQRLLIIGNISIADITTILIADVLLTSIIIKNKLELNLFTKIMITIACSSHLVSMLTNLLLCIDRFIAVQFCLSYHTLVTKSKLYISITCLWLFSLIVENLLAINLNDLYDYHLRYGLTITSFRVVVSILIIITSILTSIIRKRHIKEIEERNKYFGIHQEKLDKLSILKKSIKETFKLNIVSVIISFIQTIFDILRVLPLNAYLEIGGVILILLLLSKLSSLLAIIFSLSEIRTELKKMICFRCGDRRVDTENNNENISTIS